MYKVLLVDDEMPALRFLQTIIEKFARELTIAQSCLSGEAALAFLRENKVDLLITDISMSGMDGIALAHAARALQPEIHIVIVTGYAEFEYAKGAIQAAVDDYILKPVSVSHMAEVLGKIKEKLDEENSLREPAMLAALLRGDAFDEQLARRRFGEGNFHFALVRWGNLGFSRGSLRSTSVLPLADEPFFALYGRDEDEQLIVSNPGAVADVFQEAVKAYMVRRKTPPRRRRCSRAAAAPCAVWQRFSPAPRSAWSARWSSGGGSTSPSPRPPRSRTGPCTSPARR